MLGSGLERDGQPGTAIGGPVRVAGLPGAPAQAAQPDAVGQGFGVDRVDVLSVDTQQARQQFMAEGQAVAELSIRSRATVWPSRGATGWASGGCCWATAFTSARSMASSCSAVRTAATAVEPGSWTAAGTMPSHSISSSAAVRPTPTRLIQSSMQMD